MRRGNPHVVYVGRANCAAEAAVCSSCGAGIGEPCIPNSHTGPVPHQCRVDLTDAIGLRDISPAPLFTQSPARPGDAERLGDQPQLDVSSLNSAGGASVSPVFFGSETT
jgi:hypothetical protein